MKNPWHFQGRSDRILLQAWDFDSLYVFSLSTLKITIFHVKNYDFPRLLLYHTLMWNPRENIWILLLSLRPHPVCEREETQDIT